MANNTTKFLDELGLATFCNKLLTKIDNNYSSKENIVWSNEGENLSDLNQFVNPGTYEISGERTRDLDNLPISNTGGGHTFSAQLSVYDSSLPNTGNKDTDCCITQVLTLSNRVGKDGNMYIRTAVGATKYDLTWEPWGKFQTNIEIGLVHPEQLNELVDNGMYSGVCNNIEHTIFYDGAYFIPTGQTNGNFMIYTYYSGNINYKDGSGWKSIPEVGDFDTINTYVLYNLSDNIIAGLINTSGQTRYFSARPRYIINNEYNPFETFVLITVNNHAVAGTLNIPVSCTQLKYGIDVNSETIVKKRVGTRTVENGVDTWQFNEWSDLGGGNSSTPKAYYNVYAQDDTSSNNFNTCIDGNIIFPTTTEGGRVLSADFNFNNYDDLTFYNYYNCGTGMIINIDKDKLSPGKSCNFYIRNYGNNVALSIKFNFGEATNANESSTSVLFHIGHEHTTSTAGDGFTYRLGTNTYLNLNDEQVNCNYIEFPAGYAVGTEIMSKFTITNLEKTSTANKYLIESHLLYNYND